MLQGLLTQFNVHGNILHFLFLLGNMLPILNTITLYSCGFYNRNKTASIPKHGK